MGTTLTCLQVYTAKKQHIKVRKSVLENIQYQILRQGYIDIPPQESKYFPDKELFIGPLGDSPWLTIIASSGNLREIAQFLSEIVDITVIFINLIDSDVVHLRRYDHGEIVDEYCNAPHFYDLYGIDPDELSDWNETEEDNLREMTRGDIEKWRDLFVEGVDPDEIRKIWDSDPIFADDILWATTKALGMNDEEIAFNSWADQDQNNFTHLAFQLKNNPAYGSNTKGLPKLTFDGYMEPGQVFVGQQLDLQITVQNNGKPFIGLDMSSNPKALITRICRNVKVG